MTTFIKAKLNKSDFFLHNTLMKIRSEQKFDLLKGLGKKEFLM